MGRKFRVQGVGIVGWTLTQSENGLVREGYSREVTFQLRQEGCIEINQRKYEERGRRSRIYR